MPEIFALRTRKPAIEGGGGGVSSASSVTVVRVSIALVVMLFLLLPTVVQAAAPTGLNAVAGDGQVTLTWNNPNNAAITGYQIRQRIYVNGAWTKFPKFPKWPNIIPGSDASTTSHVVRGLTNGVRYSFQIRWMVGKKGGKPSEANATPAAPAAPPPPKPSKPTGLRTVAGNNQATLIWNNPNNAAITKYQYKQWNSLSTERGARWTDIPGSNTSTTSHVVRGLTNTSVIYRFRIRAVAGPSIGPQSSSAGAIITVPPAAPVVTATPGNAKVTLRWSRITSYITRYQIKQWTGSSEPANGWKDIPGSGSSTTSHVVRGLTNGESYSFRIRAVAICYLGRTTISTCSVPGTPSTSVSPTPVPGKPAVTPMPGDAQVTLSWSNPNDVAITKYQIKQWTGSSESGSWTDISGSGSSTTSHVVRSLTNGESYSFRIRAVAGTNVAGTPSDPVRTVLLDKPVVSASAGDTLVTLSWSDPNDASITKYQVKQWTGSRESGSWTEIWGSVSSTTSHMVGRLTNGVRYSFRIRAMVGLFPGVESDPVSAMPVPDKPAVTATPGNALVTLSWSNPNDASITKYQIKQWTGSSESGSWTDISGSGSSTTSHVVRGLTNGVRYSFRIRAVTGTNASGTPSDPVSETPATQPDKPAVTATPAGDSLVRLSWSNPNDASITGYQIKRWTGSSERGRWTDISGSGKDTITYTVPGLTNGVRYHFRIRAMAGRVPGMGSDVASATPVADKPIVTATPGNAQVTLSWSNPNDASITGYQIKQWTGSSESGSWTDISGSGSSTTSHVVRGLTNGVRYSFRIRAMVGAVTRTPSDPVSATPVSPPVGLKATAGDSQVTLNWRNPNNPTITGYQLKKHDFRNDSLGLSGGSFVEGSWTDIPGSGKNTTSYVVTGLTNGARYGFEIRAVAGSVTGEESEFVPVTLRSIFTITGTVTQGETLTADTSTISDPDGPKSLTFTYQWKRDGSAISSATSGTYVLTQADVGAKITVTVSWTDGGGTAETLTSTATAKVANVNDPPTGAVTITGTATQGQTLTADTSTIFDPDGPSSLTFSYQWKRDGTDISGAIGRTYILTQADIGAKITVTVSWTDAGSTAESFISAATTSVTNTNQSPTGAVTISGTVTQGQTLTAVTSTISDPDGPSSLTFTYQWKRGVTAISSATSSTYTLTQTDVGAAITVTVSWTDDGGTAESFTSAATAKVANVNDPPTGAVTITGTATQKQTLTADTSGVSDPDGPSNLVFSYQWKRDGNNISSATSGTYVLTQADVGKAITVTVSWTDAYGASESLTSAATAKVVNVNDRPTGTVAITGTPTQGQTLTADTSGISDPDVPDTDSLTFTYQWTRGPDTVSRTSTYTLTQADVGEIITVVVAYHDGGRRELFLASTPKVANLNDLPTGAVTITGTATQGQTLIADTSGISDPDGPASLTFSYQWNRDRSAISGATGNTHVLTQADVGKAITVTVSWTDAGSTAESLTSAATANVANLNDSPTGAVTITGTVTQGQTLTADTSGISDPDGPASLTFTYQWKRDGSDISSATGRTYTLTQADVGKAISVTVSWTDAGSIVETLTSAATASVTNLNDSPTGAVTITGTVTQGQTLTADTSGISDPDGPASLTFTYQWKRDGSDISSATGRTYTLTQADVGKAISVTVSWTDAGSIVETLTSAATANVANLNDSPTGAVTITGTVTQGQTLTADTSGISDPDGPASLTFSYQWNRDRSAISGATGNTHVLTQADVGKAITVTVSWTDAGSTAESLTSAATANVANLNDSPTGAVTITGTVTQGQTLTADTSGISDPDGPASLTFTYQWKRDGSDISSATGRTYTLTQADVGKAISVIVSWTDAGSTAETLTSVATASVTNINDSPTGSVTITGTVTQGQTLTADTSTIVDPDGPASLTFTYQWKRDGSDISSATGRTYTLTQADVGKAISVIVSWTDAGSTAETLTSVATASVTNINDSPTGSVTITGTVTQGQTLTADTSTIVDPDGPASLTFTYQWKRDGSDISSATGRTYTLTQADVGKAISVIVSWTDAGSTAETLTSVATASVTNINDSPTGSVTITGTVTQGQTLTADTSTIVDPDGPASLTFTYQWKRDGSDISSATGRTYTLTQADVGKAISVIVSWTDAGSTAETLTSVATASVTNINDSPTGSVTITGTVTQGQTLTADTSTIVDPDGPASLTFTYQWKRDGSDISSATGRTYTLTQADVGKAISVIVSWTDAGSTAESLTSAATANVANLNDSPTGAVTITGTVTQGQTLTADTSGISDPDGPASLTFTYQWKRDGSDISSATGRTYTLTQADVGKAISVIVSWTDAGSIVETLTSAATANVANLNDPPTGAVTISGTVTQGQTLTADTSTIVDPDGPSNLVFSYQWTRDGSAISSATGRTYTLTQADVGAAISVTVSWTDAGGESESLTSTATANVANINDAPTGAVTITGTVTQGQTLTADTSGISDPDGPSSLTFTYQWKRDGSDISSATGRTYTLTQADVGKAISVIVSWTDAGSTAETLTSVATASVTNINDSPTGSVTITGTVTQGQTLTADTSTIVDPDGPASLTFTYQWKRDGSDISSATGRTYTLTQADVGKAISVIVSWTDAGSTAESLTSAATANVANLNDSPTGAVTITGTVTQGQTLTADTSGISDPDGPASLTFTYQWKRDGSDISSATGRTYTLTQADVGKAISVIVSWTDAGSIVETLTSAATANVANLNDPPTGAVTISGTVTQGQTLTADTSTIVDPDGPSNLVFSYQWTRDGSAISSATGRTYTLTQADVGAAISVTVSWTDAGGESESLTSTATANVANINDAPTGAVTITGTVTQGQTLTADTSGISDPDGPSSLTFTYQWKRGAADISSATGRTYTLTQADVGAAITVTVSWTDAGGESESLTSTATANVANLNDPPTGAVTITGTATQGQTLTADTSGVSDPDGPSNLTFTYQWKRGAAAISSATGRTYVLTQTDVGAAISVTVSWTDSGSTAESLTSAATANVANLNDAPTGAVTITGTVTQGQELTAVTSTIVDPDGPSNLVFSYQWTRDGSAISSATSSTYTLTQADVGAKITVTVSWTDAGGESESLTSTATANVANLNDAPTGAVTITGTVTQGQTLTADTSTIVDPDGPSNPTFSYQWKRDGTAIVGATSRTYILTQADVGKAISVTVSWTDAGGESESLTSTATANVANINDSPTGAVTITGTVTQGQTLTADTSGISDPDGPASLTFSYQWNRDGSAISGATGNTHVLTQADVGKAISVTVSWTDAGGESESLTSTATSDVANLNDAPTGAVTITGTVTQGQTLTADTSGISDPDGPSSLVFTYQWKRDGTAIVGATSRTYILTQADVGAAISVTVSWTDAGSTAESLTSAATSSVALSVEITGVAPGTTKIEGNTITTKVDGAGVQLTLPAGHGVAKVAFAVPRSVPAAQVGVTFGEEPAYVDIRIGALDAKLSSAASVCLEEPAGLSGTLFVYHLADGANTWEKLLPALAAPNGYVCGKTKDFSIFVVGSPMPVFGSAFVDDYVWTVGEAVDVQLPAATGGDGPITYRLSPSLPAGLTFNATARTITGTPNKVFATAEFTYTATDADGHTGQLQFRVTVQSAEVKERPRALAVALASFGRTAAAEAVDVISRRFIAAPVARSGITLGGTALSSVGSGSASAVLSLAEARGESGATVDGLNPGLITWRGVSARELFSRSDFVLPLQGTKEDRVRTGWTFWGQGSAGRFSGEANAIETDGELHTGYMGLDYRFGSNHNALAGVAFSHSAGEVDYAVAGDFLLVNGERGGITGEVDLAMTSVLPYVHYTPRLGLGIWGLAGAGSGEVKLKDQGGSVETDVRMVMAAVGVRQRLKTWRGVDFAVKSDVLAVELKTDAAAGLEAVTGDARRARLALEMGAERVLSPDALLRPDIEFSGRWDEGDADNGIGVEISGGVAYVQSRLGLRLGVRGRYLLAHEESEFADWGGSFALQIGEGLGGHGLWLSYEPQWGAPASGVEQLWDSEGIREVGGAGRMKFDLGYGMTTRGRGWLVTPYGGVLTTGQDTRYRLGAQAEVDKSMDISLEGVRRENAEGATEHGIFLRWKILL